MLETTPVITEISKGSAVAGNGYVSQVSAALPQDIWGTLFPMPARVPDANEAEAISGQMEKIKTAVEQLLRDGAPLSILKPTQALPRVIDQLKSTGVNVRELSHQSTYKRFRERYSRSTDFADVS